MSASDWINRCYIGDASDGLRTFIGEGIKAQTCVVSPPYWGLRDYGTAEWQGGAAECEHKYSVSSPYNAGFNERWGNAPGAKKQESERHEVSYKQGCGKCGATRIDKQLGLEPTIAEYVANMVEVFRLVRDVLADDGTLWLNLGDSYAANGPRSNNNGTGATSMGWPGQNPTTLNKAAGIKLPAADHGLKPKDLCGIPWRVAFALQQPYYTGTIKNVEDRIWLAAIIDGEGCFFIHKRKAGTLSYSKFTRSDGSEANYERTADTFGVGLEICNTNEAIIDRVRSIVATGTMTTQSPEQNSRRKQTIYRWRVAPNEAKRIAQELYPHLVAKQHQARLIFNCPSSGEAGTAAHQAMMNLHNGIGTTVDYPAPPTMFEPGWFLRQDVIWSKTNCMPESVTDRCTKSHEYIFLLSKNARYFYDADAIAEPVSMTNGAQAWRKIFDPTKQIKESVMKDNGLKGGNDGERDPDQTSRNKRSVWTVTTQPYSEAHFATFPPKLIEPCILAGSRVGDVVLDPFMGSGTVGQVSQDLGRRWIGCELNPEYVKLQGKRTAQGGLELHA